MIEDAVYNATQYGREICGLLVDNGYFTELIRVENKCKKGGGFAFYSGEIKSVQKAVLRLNHEIIGTFHSHPYDIAKPGDSDIRYAVDDSFMLIIDVTDKKAGLWHIRNQKIKKISFHLI